ncbi:hypothetical protein KQ300_09465 [Synechococcus sp. CS-1331]|uniref:beta strand repeat-containing protein n=1 Tax=Synechococcus sp. CS-1331 TaxID=2847973 RepID=UPI00223BAB90|nr:hypothetical protein [Synechococcus sp. CS-1331]MCT0228408.1 hypothetical protein [Synechococcus sp. CS-1331]
MTVASGATLNISGYTIETLGGMTNSGTVNVTTANGAVLDSANLADANTITIGAGTATIDASATDEAALAAKITVNNSTTLTINNYVNTDLSGLSNQGTGSIVVNTTTSAVLNETYLADATSVVLGAAATGAASAIDGIGTNGGNINLNNQTLSVSGYTTENLSGITTAGILNVTTVTGAVLDSAKLATADSITLVGTNTATAADADTLGSRLGGTATLNITTEPITADTNLSDLGSSLTLQFGGNNTTVVDGATLTVRQNQVSGYTISGTGTVAAAGTENADNFDASGITATTNFTSLAGADSVTIAPSALGGVDVIDGGADTDTLIFSAAASGVVDVAFTNVTSVEILQLANGTNSVSLGSEAEQAGTTTVTGSTGDDTLNLLYGTTGLTFTAGTGSDTLSYSADSATQSITLSSVSSGTASGTVSNGGTDSFTGLEAIVGGSGTADSITSTSAGEALIVTGANAGTIDGFSFSGVESVDLADGNDTGTINTGGSLSGSLSFGSGTSDSLSYAGYGSAVSATLSGSNTLSSVTAITGGVSGVENITLSSNNDNLTVGGSGSLSGNVDFGAGSGDTLSYAGYSDVVSVTLTGIASSAGSTAAGGATAISGTSAGFENLIGGSNSGDTITDSTGDSTIVISGANSGTIDGMAFSAIENLSLSTGIDGVTVSTGGALSGNLSLGGGSSNTLLMDSGAGAIGSVSAAGGNDTITINGGTVTGAVNLGDGANALTINNTASTIGSYTGGSGVDTIDSKGGDVLGALSTGAAADSVTLSLGAKITGAVTLGADSDSSDGSDTLTLNASSITGEVRTGSGADAVNVLTGSTITGNVTLGTNSDIHDGGDTLTVTGTDSSSKSVITGSITTGAGVDTLTLTNATIGGAGQTISLGSDSSSLDGNDKLTATGTAITAAISTGSGADELILSAASSVSGNITLGIDGDTSTASNADTLTLNASSISGNVSTGSGADVVTLNNTSTITGTVNLGSNADAYDGNDSLTLSSGSNIVGNVDLGAASDTLTLSTGISSATTVTGDVGFGVGNADMLSYSGNTGPITVALDEISADAVGTATDAKASYITGNVTGFEAIIGSDYTGPTTDSVIGDTIYDNTGDSLVILTGSNAGTIDNLDFSSIENLQLRSGADTLSFQGTSVSPGSIAGRADAGGIEGASYTNGVYSGGTKTDDAIDLLDYTSYDASSGASIDLSQNKATGVYGGLAGGLISGDGSIVNETFDSSFENVDGSRFDDLIIGDDQDTQGNVLRGFGGNDTILGLAGDDTIDGGDGTNGPDGNDLIAGGDGADLILGSAGNDFISGGGYSEESGTYYSSGDESIDTLSYIGRNEGLDLSLTGKDEGSVQADAGSSLTVSTFTNTYSSAISQQLITAPSNQVTGTDWTDMYGDIQNLVLTNQNDIVRLDPTDVNTGSIDANGGSLDTLDYSSFDAASPVLVNLSGSTYSFDFDANGVIDTTVGEITIANANSATNVMVGEASSQGGANGVLNFEVVIGGAGDDAIVGNASDNLLVGNAGADRIDGGAGNDTIYGGTGDDYIIPGAGADYVNAGAGINTIAITSSDLAEDTFAVDPNGINIFALQGNGSSSNSSSIDAPSGNWNPGSQGIDLLDGGDPVVNSGGVTVYDTINGTASADTYQFGGVAFKNIGNVDLGAGDDSLGTAATTKGVKVNYDGGSGTDSVTLNLTFAQFAKLNASGLYVADVQNFLDNTSGNTFSSSQADFTATNFETGGVAVISPAVYNALQGDPLAITFNSAYGLLTSTITSGDDINLTASALTTSTATALSVPDIVSAFVQASGVKGSDAITLSSGGSTTGSTTASQDASAVARTVDDRADSVLSAYALGTDRSSITAGDAITLSLSGNVKADTTAESLGFVVNSSGTVEAAGSRDSSLTAGDALSLSISGTAAQTVAASNVAGLALAALASRTYGIDDANLTDSAADSVQAGSDLSLQATASSSNRVTAQTVGTESLGSLTLFNNGIAATDRFTTTQIGAAFPLINGDRVRFTTSNGSVQADRDYYVANVIPVTGEFQLSSEPNGDPIDVVAADNGSNLQAYRPAVATADAISTVTGVDLNRTVANGSGVQAGESLSLRASAADAITATASSVAGDATAGVFRLGGMDSLNLASEVSTVQALVDTASLAGSGATLSLNATDTATLSAASTDGAALTEANIQVFGSKSSASTAGDDLSLSANAELNLSGSASSTAGSAEARSGAGAGAGVSTAGVTNVVPTASSYSVVTGLADGTQTAGADLAVQAKGATTLNATASTVSGAESLSSLWTSATGNILATFDLNLNTTTSTPSFVGPQYLAAGQLVQLDTASAAATGLAADTDYAVKLLGFGAVDASNTGSTPNSITMPTGITYAVNDAVRFRLNSTAAPNSGDSRYGLALGNTYYVVNPTATSFQLSASPGGSVIDLTPDSLGAADQLVDADRFQLLTLPSAAGGTYAVAPVTASASGVGLTLPAVANAFAGSREADRTLNNSDNLNLAQVSGISGNAGLRGLFAGAQNAITAMATGVLNAVARNTDGDATASAGLVAEGLSDTAISAGSAGTVKADATITAVADAATTGDNALVDNALADLTITARGLTASDPANTIAIAGTGDVQSTASLSGRSTASTVLGDSDALAALKATGLEALSNGFTASIGQQGDISATASIGSLAAPLIISALSSAEGDATAQAAAAAVGILGSYDATAPAGFSSLQAGTSQGDISGTASADLQLSAIATNGAASVTLADVPGSGRASITGIENMALTAGAGLSSVDATAVGRANLSARSVELDATSQGSTASTGVFSSTVAALPISFAEDGRIAAIAQQSSFAQSVTVNGNATTSLNNTSLGIGNATITIAGDGSLDARALSQLESRSQSVAGDARA